LNYIGIRRYFKITKCKYYGKSRKSEIKILKECIERYFDMPKNSRLHRDFYSFVKEELKKELKK